MHRLCLVPRLGWSYFQLAHLDLFKVSCTKSVSFRKIKAEHLPMIRDCLASCMQVIEELISVHHDASQRPVDKRKRYDHVTKTVSLFWKMSCGNILEDYILLREIPSIIILSLYGLFMQFCFTAWLPLAMSFLFKRISRNFFLPTTIKWPKRQ